MAIYFSDWNDALQFLGIGTNTDHGKVETKRTLTDTQSNFPCEA